MSRLHPTSVSCGLLNKNLSRFRDRSAITVEFACREGGVPIRMCTLPGVTSQLEPYPSPPYPWQSRESEDESSRTSLSRCVREKKIGPVVARDRTPRAWTFITCPLAARYDDAATVEAQNGESGGEFLTNGGRLGEPWPSTHAG
jgi:hypothetical protein